MRIIVLLLSYFLKRMMNGIETNTLYQNNLKIMLYHNLNLDCTINFDKLLLYYIYFGKNVKSNKFLTFNNL